MNKKHTKQIRKVERSYFPVKFCAPQFCPACPKKKDFCPSKRGRENGVSTATKGVYIVCAPLAPHFLVFISTQRLFFLRATLLLSVTFSAKIFALFFYAVLRYVKWRPDAIAQIFSANFFFYTSCIFLRGERGERGERVVTPSRKFFAGQKFCATGQKSLRCGAKRGKFCARERGRAGKMAS